MEGVQEVAVPAPVSRMGGLSLFPGQLPEGTPYAFTYKKNEPPAPDAIYVGRGMCGISGRDPAGDASLAACAGRCSALGGGISTHVEGTST